MVDGVAAALGYLRDQGACEEIEEVRNAAAAARRSGEILREMRGADVPEAVWFQVGMQIGFSEAALLFACLLEQQGQLGHFLDCATQGVTEECRFMLRSLRANSQLAGASQGREDSQQRVREFADSVRRLPQAPPLVMNGWVLAHGSPARVGRLRGYGDGIVAEVAAEFVRAYMETNR
jgi:hypothetical protein